MSRESSPPASRYTEALALIQRGRSREALALLESVIQHVDARPDAQVLRAKALLQRGVVLQGLDDIEGALDDYQSLVPFAKASDPAAREMAAWGLSRKARLLHDLGRLDEAMNAFAEIASLFAADSSIEVKRLASDALLWQAHLRQLFGDDSEAIRLTRDLVDQFRRENDDDIQVNIARALMTRADAMQRLGHTADALSSYGEVDALARSRPVPDAELLEQAAWAVANSSRLLGDLGRHAEVISAAPDASHRFDSVEDDSVSAAYASFLINLAHAYDALGRKDDELGAYDKLVRRYGATVDPRLGSLVLTALVNRAAVLRQMARIDEALAAYATAASRYGATSEAAVRRNVARARYFEAELLSELGRTHDALRAYSDLIAQFDGDSDDEVVSTVESAKERRASLVS